MLDATRTAWLTSCSTSSTVMPGRQQLGQERVDLPDDHRREPQRQLVEQQDPRVGDQRPADRDGLLLAARQLRRPLAAPVAHPPNSS